MTLTKYAFKVTWWPEIINCTLFWIPWPWKPYPWHSDHLCSINTSWDNVDRLFRSCDLDQIRVQGHVMTGHYYCTLFGFLDPENHILDTLITSVALIHPEIMLIDHLAMWPWPNTFSKVTWWSVIIDFVLFWIPWPGKPYSRHGDHLSIIYRPWDNRTYRCWWPSWTPSWILDSSYRWETPTSNFLKTHANTKKMRPLLIF